MDPATHRRFMAKVRVEEGGCWLWIGARNSKGYGCLGVDGKTQLAHRLAYEHWLGPLDAGLLVCHTCDVRPCVNPAHLWTGTHGENVADCVAKGRQVRGEKNARAKLTAELVQEIRLLAADYTWEALARQYGVSPAHLKDIIGGRYWTAAV